MTWLPRPAATLLIVVLGLSGVWLSSARPATRSATTVDPAELAAATGRVSVENKRKGRALLVARRLAPGRSATGSITLRNRSPNAAALRLTQAILSAKPGKGGAKLTTVLQLVIREGSTKGKVVFKGMINKLKTRKLRRLPGKRSRRYVFTVSLPRTLDNRYQAASLVVRYLWKGSAASGSTGGAPFATGKRSTRTKRGR